MDPVTLGLVGEFMKLPFQMGGMILGDLHHSENMQLQTDLMNKQIQMQRDINDQNIQFVKEQNEINRQREDTAIQRGVADAKAAGLSPLAGIGGASSTYASAPQAQAPDIGSFAGNMASLSNSSAQVMSNNIANLTQSIGSVPANIMQLEGLSVQNKKAQADLEAQELENIYNAMIAEKRVEKFNDEALTAKAQRELDEYVTQKVSDLKLYPSNFSSGTPNTVKTLIDTATEAGTLIDEHVKPKIEQLKEYYEKKRRQKQEEKEAKKAERRAKGGWRSHLPDWLPF